MLSGLARMPLLLSLYVPSSQASDLPLTVRLGQLCQLNQKREKRFYTSYWTYIVFSHQGKRLNVELNDISQAASGCKFLSYVPVSC